MFHYETAITDPVRKCPDLFNTGSSNMQFESFHWLSHRAICSTNMVNVRVIFWGVFIFYFGPCLHGDGVTLLEETSF